MIDRDRPLWQLTVGELLDILQSERLVQKLEKTPEKRIVYGLKGIAEIFGCSTSTAQRIKNSGKIKKAITQVGRKIVVDADLALRLFREK
ncbi:DUF3853 family protein [Petrimonas sulfuriphila]|uniref:DUF3853 family protein n=1 Tax=Petrimonas sulfuriphila TaxID=285070 RepID=UPI003EBA0649